MSQNKKDSNSSDDDPYKIPHQFVPIFTELLSCGGITHLNGYKEELIDWDIYTTMVYSFLWNRIRALQNIYISYDWMSSCLNISHDTIQSRVKIMEDCGILTVYKDKENNGTMKTNRYTYIVDVLSHPSYKVVDNKYKQAFKKRMQKRKKRLELLYGVVVETTWTKEQAYNYWRNTNHELMTNTYLVGDKTEKLLFLKEENRDRIMELKEYELQELESRLPFQLPSKKDKELEQRYAVEEEPVEDDEGIEDSTPTDVIPF